MRIIFIVILLALAVLLGLLAAQHRIVLVPGVEAAASCPVEYEPSQGIEGYVWTPCFEYQGVDGCYGIRDNGITNSVISCPQACCEDNYGGQFVSVR